jgi:taurine---2-oxoglutarate transaminase
MVLVFFIVLFYIICLHYRKVIFFTAWEHDIGFKNMTITAQKAAAMMESTDIVRTGTGGNAETANMNHSNPDSDPNLAMNTANLLLGSQIRRDVEPMPLGANYLPWNLRRSLEQQRLNLFDSKDQMILSVSSSLSSFNESDPLSADASCDDRPTVLDPSHLQPLGSWSPLQVDQSRQLHAFCLTWVPNHVRHSLPHITHGEGVYLYDGGATSGGIPKQYLDWTSQAVCANLGHSIPNQIVQGVIRQMERIPYVYGGLAVTEVRIRLNALLNDYVLPKPLCVAVYPSSGAEANEAGIVLAQRYTGRTKIISFYRSYHGATGYASAVTGDPRRCYNPSNNICGSSISSHSSTFIKAFHPFPLFFQHHGTTSAEQVSSALLMLEELVCNEGPHTIASIVMESIVGAGGCLIMPISYMEGLRALCNKYGILLHLDEVMVGFGRTGTMFGFQHYNDVVPDIVTAAKGLTAASVPLSMMACSQTIMDHFENQPLGWGSTYESHPVALASAYETIKYLLQENLLNHVQSMAPIFRREMDRLSSLHPCIKQYRAIGLFGCFDVHDTDGCSPKLPFDSADRAFHRYSQAYAENGLIGLHRYPHIHCAPPLIISMEELLDGFERLHRALLVLDDALGFCGNSAKLTGSTNDHCSVTFVTSSSSSSMTVSSNNHL